MNASTSSTITSLFFASEFKKEVLTWISELLIILMFFMLSYLTGRKLPKSKALKQLRQKLNQHDSEA